MDKYGHKVPHNRKIKNLQYPERPVSSLPICSVCKKIMGWQFKSSPWTPGGCMPAKQSLVWLYKIAFVTGGKQQNSVYKASITKRFTPDIPVSISQVVYLFLNANGLLAFQKNHD